MSVTTSMQADHTIVKSHPPTFFQMLSNHPAGFWFIFWGEFAERCSYYGMRAILAVYMADTIGFGKGNAGMFMSGRLRLLGFGARLKLDSFVSVKYIEGDFIKL